MSRHPDDLAAQARVAGWFLNLAALLADQAEPDALDPERCCASDLALRLSHWMRGDTDLDTLAQQWTCRPDRSRVPTHGSSA